MDPPITFPNGVISRTLANHVIHVISSATPTGFALSARMGLMHGTRTHLPVHTPECNGAHKCLYAPRVACRGTGGALGRDHGLDDHARCSQRVCLRTPSLCRRPSATYGCVQKTPRARAGAGQR